MSSRQQITRGPSTKAYISQRQTKYNRLTIAFNEYESKLSKYGIASRPQKMYRKQKRYSFPQTLDPSTHSIKGVHTFIALYKIHQNHKTKSK